MQFFPTLLRFDDKSVLLVGGGDISLFKLQKIISFGPNKIKIISKEFGQEFQNFKNVELVQKEFESSDLVGIDLAIIAIDDKEKQREIYNICKKQNILCNCVDLLDCCDFIFPSIVKRGDISISISTNGKVPGLSAVLREYFESLIPSDLENVLKELTILRESLVPGKERMQKIREAASVYIQEKFKWERL